MLSGGVAIGLIGGATIALGLAVASEPGETNRLPFFGWDTSMAAFVAGGLLVALGAVLIVTARRISVRVASVVGRTIWAVLGAAVAFLLIAPLYCTSGSTGPDECQALIGFSYVVPGGPSSSPERSLFLNAVIAAIVGALIWFLPVMRRARAGRASRAGSA